MSNQSAVYGLIKELSERKIKLWLEGEALKFKAPKGAMDAELKNQILQNKIALVTFLKERQQSEHPVLARPDKDSYPISNAQQRLWFIDQYSGAEQKAAYNIPVALDLKGPLDIQALEHAINALIKRHEVLQTRFVSEHGLPRQIKAEQQSIQLPCKDLSQLTEEEKQFQCQEIIDSNLASAFSLDNWPLFKTELIKLSQEQHIFLATMHHIIADAWSMEIVVREIAEYYQQYKNKSQIEVEPLSLQYADFAYWQTQKLQQQQSQIEFWKEYLKDSSVLELPLDKKRIKHARQKGAHAFAHIDRNLYTHLKQLAQEQGVTLFALLISGFTVLLSRFSGQQDINVGLPVANRTRAEWEQLIGFFVNSLVLRTCLDGNPNFSTLLKTVYSDMLAIYSNQDVPFDKLVETLVNQRESGHTPLFQVMFSLQNTPSQTQFSLAELEIKSLDNHLDQARYDMTWNLQENNQAITIDLEYRSDLFHAQSIKAYLDYYVYLLQDICSDPNARIDDYQLQHPDNTLRQQLVFNPQASAYPRERLLYSLFESRVDKNPDAVAISAQASRGVGNKLGSMEQAEVHRCSYKTLKDTADTIATHLHQQGVNADERVLLALPRGLTMTQSLLAVLKLGAAYVPLDPDYPDERKQFIVNDSGARCLITSKVLVGKLGKIEQGQVKFLYIEDLCDLPAGVAKVGTFQAELEKQDSGKRAACIFYTSGSTGSPKGVIVPHRAIVRLVCNNSYYNFSSDDVTGHISNVCFDASSMEIWGALLNGGRIHVIDQDCLLSASAFAKTLLEQNVSVMFLSMGLFRVYAEENPDMFRGLSTLLIGGEAVDLAAAKRVLQTQHPPLQLMNGYGPTENATFTTSYAINEVADDLPSMPLGQSIAHSQVFIADDTGNLLPAGIPGELICAGDGLALAYLNQPELNKEKFCKGFLKALPDETIYRSGDVARYDCNGQIILQGRVDEQIKLRGFRVEPGEIENLIEGMDYVSSVCVALKQHPSGENYLIAYVSLKLSQEQQMQDVLAQIKGKVREQLPAYMQPSFYQLITGLPINANGKVNKRALPDPDWNTLGDIDYVAAQSPVEKALEAIWCDLLSLPKVSVKANFFELGGHSLLATRMVSRIQEQFSVELQVKHIFDNPDIETLARFLGEYNLISVTKEKPAIPKLDRQGLFPLSKAQERLWFMQQMNPESTAYGMPMAASIEGALNIKQLEAALDALVERQESLRTRFVLDGDQVKQKVLPAQGSYYYRFEKMETDEQLEQAIRHNQQRCFDLEQGPLFFVELIQCAPQRFVILMNMHHIISDGWSMQILQDDLIKLYQDQNSLPELNIQYLDFSHWQKQYLNEKKTESLLDFWKNELKGVAEVLHLPADYPRAEQQSFKGALYRHSFNPELEKRALDFCKQHQISSFILGISCYALLLSRYAQQDDFCIGIPVSGRDKAELENIIGFFVNGIVIRSDLRKRLSVKELLEQFKQKSLEAFKHQDLSADILIDALDITPNTKYQPLAQVAFSHQSIDSHRIFEVDGVRFKMLDSENHSAKYDLLLSLGDDGKSLELCCEYATDLFERNSIAQLMQHYESLLEQMINKPDAISNSLSWYTQDDILAALNKHQAIYTHAYPLSLNQEAIYLDALINPDSRQNAIANIMEITQDIDIQRWQQAFEIIQQQHEVFRSDIIQLDLPGQHQAYQAIRQVPENTHYSYVDLSEYQLSFEQAVQRLEAEAYCTYDIEHDALYHYSLYKLAPQHYVAMLRAHHIIFDGVSGKLFLEEICSSYEALTDKKQPSLLEDCFEDFVRENRQLSDQKDCIDFWQEKTRAMEALSFDGLEHRPDRSYSEPSFEQRHIHIDAQLSKRIKNYCRGQGITPAIFFKCIYALVIHEYCRPENDFFLLEYAHGRARQYENSYGVYYQQTPFVLDQSLFELNETGREQAEALFVYARQFQKQFRKEGRVFREFSVQAQSNLLPYAGIGFMYNYTQFEKAVELLGKQEKSVFLSPRAQGQVQLFVRERQADYELLLLFGNDYFNDYQLLERMQSFSDKLVCQQETDLLLDIDHALLNKLNHDFKRQVVPDSFLLDDFSKHAKNDSRHDKQALLVDWLEQSDQADRGDIQTVSYNLLDQKSSQLVLYLVEQVGLTEGARVALYCPLDEQFFVALYALLKAGVCYVPISTKWPCERVEKIIEQGQIAYVLTNKHLQETIQVSQASLIVLDDIELPSESVRASVESALQARPKQAERHEPELDVTQTGSQKHDQQCLYSIFTSGSTGQAKGAMVSRAGENNLLHWYEQVLSLSENDTSILISDPGFDLSQKNFFAFLRNGGKVLIPDQTMFDPQTIRHLIQQHQVSHINCAPSAFYALLEGGEASWQALKSLRWVVLGGEAIMLSELKDWYQSPWCEAQIMNSYGPTECTDVVCFHILQASDFADFDTANGVPLGKAINNAQLYVLNSKGHTVPAGIVGEIAIGGACLGLGYIALAKLNQESFISIETSQGQQRVYLSGDLGRINRHGQLEYIGRKDFQVKLRGQRIELGEISQSLRKLDSVRDALVILHEQALIAYVLTDDSSFDSRTVLDKLAKLLPAYMLPKQIIPLLAWPLNTNGKIDRKGLPAPYIDSGKPHVAPRNDTEAALAEIWCELLALPEVSVHDSFFELGGHSLLASRAVSRLKEHFKVEFPLKALFDLHTIADIAEYIDGLKWALESKEKQNQTNKEENREEGFL